MTGKSVALAIASGFATFLIVGIGVGELAHQWFGLVPLLGVPVGAIAGGVATAVVSAGLTGEVEPRSRRIAGGFGGFTVGFLLGFLAAGWLAHLGVSASIIVGLVVGSLAAAWLAIAEPTVDPDAEL